MSTQIDEAVVEPSQAVEPPEEQSGVSPAEPASVSDNTPEPSSQPTDASGGESQQRTTSTLSWLARTIPTLAVIATLAGLGLWGHHHGWKVPKFSELTGNRAVEGVAWCEEHGVAEAECIACNADLRPKRTLHGWCKEHGVHECVLHHPDVAQLNATPEIPQTDLDRAARALALKPRAENNSTCKMHLRRIQFPTAAAADKAGIDINLVDRGRVVESVSATGEIVYDPTRVARLSSRAAGTVWRVEKNVGDRVHKGEVLALVEASDVGRAKAELLQAVTRLHLQIKTHERLAGLGDIVPGRRTLEAESAKAETEVAVDRAIQSLVNFGLHITREEVRQTPDDQLKRKVHFLGMPSSITRELDPAQTTSNLIPVVAPRDGIVVLRDAVAGEVVDTSKNLFTLADTSRMWLVLNVPLEEVKHVADGQEVIFHPDGADHADTGTLTWISTDVDAETRTVMVRGELPNEDGHLRNETFGAGEIVLREERDAIVVSRTAVHWEGCCHVVFVRDKDYMKKGAYKVFHTRSVRPGVNMGDHTEMIAGLFPGEVVVTKGSAVLRAELLKGNLGAG
jgi:cobalt-zinc-cadmium efflux system membrane fusion protein